MTDPESPGRVGNLVRDALQHHAEEAPDGAGLLSAVHARSHRLRVRHRVRLAAAGAVAAVAVTLAVPQIVTGTRHPVPGDGTATTGGTVGPLPSAGSSVATSAPPATPTAAGSTSSDATGAPATTLSLAAPDASQPVFPLRLASAGAWREPVVTLDGGVLTAFHEARDPEGDADLALVVSPGRPEFATASVPVTQTSRQVRGRPGTLRTVRHTPTAELTLYWQESPDRWVQVRTDDTYRPEQVAQFAESLTGAALALAVPLRLDLAPVGAVLDTATASVLAWRSRDQGTPVLRCTLYQRRALRGTTIAAGRRRAVIDRSGPGASIEVDLPDDGMSLLIEVPAPYRISDEDLVRLAATAQVTSAADPKAR